ncbi:MAG: hypothetical protein R3C09_14830 [Pirellulaceae bacterium]|jgi:hypothetical protein
MKLLHVAFFLLLFDVVAVFSQTIKIENIGTKNVRVDLGATPSINADGRIFVGPDPNDKKVLLQLATEFRVQKELGLDELQLAAIRKLMKEYEVRLTEFAQKKDRNGFELQAIVQELDESCIDAVEEIFSIAQFKRLSQIAYRVEVSIIGLGKALTEGRLGKQIQVYENQYERIERRSEQIEQQLQSDIIALYERAELELAEELPPDKRKMVLDLIGKPFVYREIGQQERARLTLLESSSVGEVQSK